MVEGKEKEKTSLRSEPSLFPPSKSSTLDKMERGKGHKGLLRGTKIHRFLEGTEDGVGWGLSLGKTLEGLLGIPSP